MVDEMAQGGWSELVPAECPCRGTGWAGSDYDVWYSCPIHGGSPHPESEPEDERGFDWAAHRIRVHRIAWRGLAARAGMTLPEFREAVRPLEGELKERTPAAWVELASQVAEDAWRDKAEARARAAGFSCRLEAAWTADAEFERACGSAGLDPEAEGRGPLAADRNSWY